MRIEQLQGTHRDRPCALLGNGPSLGLYDFDKIPILLFGINRSWIDPHRDYPHKRNKDSYYHYASDVIHAEEFDQGLFGTHLFFHRYIEALKLAGCITKTADKFVEVGHLLKEWGKGKYAGPCALMVALYLGFNPIYLVGFDLVDGQRKFYVNDPQHGGENAVYVRQRKYFKQIATELPQGVHVYNCNPNSTLDCFPVVEKPGWMYD